MSRQSFDCLEAIWIPDGIRDIPFRRDIFLRNAICPAGREGIHIISRESKASIYRICEANISRRRKAIYRRKETQTDEKTIKELAVELTVELSELCDSIKAKSIFTNQLLRSCSSI